MEKKDLHHEKHTKVYELGYLLIPTIPEENVPAEVQAIKNVLEKHDTLFITEDFPKLRQLAYTMTKTSGSQHIKFDKGYFGWIKFEVSSVAIPEIKAELQKNDHIFRMMIINTVRENTMVAQKVVFRPTVPTEAEKVSGEVKEEQKMSEEEIDKTIENLVVE